MNHERAQAIALWAMFIAAILFVTLGLAEFTH